MTNKKHLQGMLLILFAAITLVVVIDNVQPKHADADSGTYPCNICMPLTRAVTVYRGVKPKICGESWSQEIDGTAYTVHVACERVVSNWKMYLWACPVCRENKK